MWRVSRLQHPCRPPVSQRQASQLCSYACRPKPGPAPSPIDQLAKRATAPLPQAAAAAAASRHACIRPRDATAPDQPYPTGACPSPGGGGGHRGRSAYVFMRGPGKVRACSARGGGGAGLCVSRSTPCMDGWALGQLGSLWCSPGGVGGCRHVRERGRHSFSPSVAAAGHVGAPATEHVSANRDARLVGGGILTYSFLGSPA